MTAILMANCKFCKSNNIETLQKTFSLCKDCQLHISIRIFLVGKNHSLIIIMS